MKKKKITEEQMSLFRKEVRDCIESNVMGGYSRYLDLWRMHSRHTGDMESDSVDIGLRGWNGFIFWRQADYYGIYRRCGFYENMTIAEFMCIVNSLWIKTATRMLREDLDESSDELAY